MKKIGLGAALGLMSVVGFAQAQTAPEGGATLVPAGFVKDTGSAERIAVADALRRITQEIPAAVCHVQNGVERPLAAEMAQHGLDQFNLLTTALLEGDDKRGIIGAEEDRRTRQAIADLEAAWTPWRAAVEKALADPADSAAATLVYTSAAALYDQTVEVLDDIKSTHIMPSQILFADAMMIDVAGTQAILAQKMSWLACLHWSGASDEAEALAAARAQYEFGFRALLNGEPALGITPPPTEEIANALSAAIPLFEANLAAIDQLLAGEAVGPEEAAALYRRLSEKMLAAEEIATLYAQHAKRIF